MAWCPPAARLGSQMDCDLVIDLGVRESCLVTTGEAGAPRSDLSPFVLRKACAGSPWGVGASPRKQRVRSCWFGQAWVPHAALPGFLPAGCGVRLLSRMGWPGRRLVPVLPQTKQSFTTRRWRVPADAGAATDAAPSGPIECSHGHQLPSGKAAISCDGIAVCRLSSLTQIFCSDFLSSTWSWKPFKEAQRPREREGGRQEPRESKARPAPPPDGASRPACVGGLSRRSLGPGRRVAEPHTSRCSGNTEEVG